MNILIDLLPNEVKINNKKYEINSDFRTSILFELLMQDEEIDSKAKVLQALELYFPKVPRDIQKAIEKMLWFYRCGKDIEKSNKKGKGEGVSQIYSYDFDDEYIYAAFLDQYNINLQKIDYLHWWEFKAMFKALKEDNELVKIMKYRAMDLRDIKDKNEKDFYKKMKEMYKIPTKQSKNDKQKINEIEQALLDGTFE
jgi:hypothetical protein